MKVLRKRLALAALMVFAVLAATSAAYLFRPLAIATYPAEFEITPASGLRSAIDVMVRAGIDPGPRRFELLVRILRRGRHIQAGFYEIAEPVTPLQLLDKLVRGEVIQVQVRIPEGWTLRQLRAVLDAHPGLRHDTADWSEERTRVAIGASESQLEGLFYPDTYVFAKGSSDLAVLRHAYRSMQEHLRREWEARAQDLPYRSPYDALIMASIIEKETGRADEREMIAGALTNRLRIGMRLQVDPTVIYGLGEEFQGNLKKSHLLRDGPYNSYTRAGLPPTPIAFPGLGSLRAALHPAQTDALYYVARGDGSSQFSRNLHDHNRAVEVYQIAPARRARAERAAQR